MLFILFSCKDPEIRWHNITKYIQERHQIESVQDFSYEHLTDQEWIDFFCIMYLISNDHGNKLFFGNFKVIREKAIRLLRFKKSLRAIQIKRWNSGVSRTKIAIRSKYDNFHDIVHSTSNDLQIIQATETWLSELEGSSFLWSEEGMSLWSKLCKKSSYQPENQISLIKNSIAKYKRYSRATIKLNIALIKDQLSSLKNRNG